MEQTQERVHNLSVWDSGLFWSAVIYWHDIENQTHIKTLEAATFEELLQAIRDFAASKAGTR